MPQLAPVPGVQVRGQPDRLAGLDHASQQHRSGVHVTRDGKRVVDRGARPAFLPALEHGAWLYGLDSPDAVEVGGEQVHQSLPQQLDVGATGPEGQHRDALGRLHHRGPSP